MIPADLLQRTRNFAILSIRFFQSLPKTEESGIIGKQFLRSSTSLAVNYRAACRARSKQEFFAKLCIVVEESDETVFWLELLIESGIINNDKSRIIKKEAEELLFIFSASKKSTKEHLNQSTNKSTNQPINKSSNNFRPDGGMVDTKDLKSFDQ